MTIIEFFVINVLTSHWLTAVGVQKEAQFPFLEEMGCSKKLPRLQLDFRVRKPIPVPVGEPSWQQIVQGIIRRYSGLNSAFQY